MKSKATRKIFVRHADFDDEADYARTVHEGGGPHIGDRWCFRGSDDYSRLMAAVWGATERDFERAAELEERQAQASRPHVFVRKWQPGQKKRTRRSRRG